MRRLTWLGILSLAAFAFGCDDGDGGGEGGAGGTTGGAGPAGGEPVGGEGGVPVPPSVCRADEDCPDVAYCQIEGEALEGVCVAGCRGDASCDDDSYCVDHVCVEGCRTEPDSCGERFFCNDQRTCERDLSCDSDALCEPEEYCGADSRCTVGCRVDPDECGFAEDGVELRCAPGSHTCEPLVPCCNDQFECAMEFPDRCDTPANGVIRCSPNPCAPSNDCEADADCPDDRYCDDEGACRLGCRVEEVPFCLIDYCDAETHVRRSCPCEGDADCAEEFFCEPGSNECVFGCRYEPDNCGEGLFCVVRQCGGCVNDDNCVQRHGEGAYCRAGACEEPCRADEECGEGEACLGGQCRAGCRDDDNEDDDTADTANRLELDAQGAYRGEDLGSRACPDDSDWYQFEVDEAGLLMRVTVEFSHADGDLDARLVAPNGDVLRAQSADDDEVFEVRDAAVGRWKLEVFSRGVAHNDYVVDIALAAGGCLPDAADPRDNNTAGAAALPFNAEGLADVQGRTICAGDEDWYQIPLGARDGLRVRLYLLGNPEDALSELDFGLFGPGLPLPDAQPAFVATAQGGGVDGQPPWVEFDAPRGNVSVQDGVYYLRVFPLDAAQRGAYRLEVALDRFRALCEPDDSEPNNAADRAFDLMQVPALTRADFNGGVELRAGADGVFNGRSLCAGDEDWYRFQLRNGDDLTATVVRPAAGLAGDTILRVLDNNLQVIEEGRNAQESNSVRVREAQGGTYFLHLAGAAFDTSTSYTLRMSRVAGPVPCPVDRLEPNEGRDAADEIPPAGLQDLTLCGDDGDVDWFHFTTDSLADITVRVNFQNAQANLDVDVFRDDSEVPENVNSPAGHGGGDGEEVVLRDRLASDWWVRVSAVDGGAATFEIEVDVDARVFVCEDDADEDNDALARATDLGDATMAREDQWICDRVPVESDWFEVAVPAGAARAVATSFRFGDDGDLFLEAYDGGGELLATTVEIPRLNSKQCIRVEAGPARTLFFRVVPLTINRILEDDERLDYTLTVADSEDCEAIPPAAPGVQWPRVSAP